MQLITFVAARDFARSRRLHFRLQDVRQNVLSIVIAVREFLSSDPTMTSSIERAVERGAAIYLEQIRKAHLTPRATGTADLSRLLLSAYSYTCIMALIMQARKLWLAHQALIKFVIRFRPDITNRIKISLFNHMHI